MIRSCRATGSTGRNGLPQRSGSLAWGPAPRDVILLDRASHLLCIGARAGVGTGLCAMGLAATWLGARAAIPRSLSAGIEIGGWCMFGLALACAMMHMVAKGWIRLLGLVSKAHRARHSAAMAPLVRTARYWSVSRTAALRFAAAMLRVWPTSAVGAIPGPTLGEIKWLARNSWILGHAASDARHFSVAALRLWARAPTLADARVVSYLERHGPCLSVREAASRCAQALEARGSAGQ